MDDLIKRLRVNAALCEPEYENDFLKAADALERQREALRELVGQVVQARDGFGVYRDSSSMAAALNAARQALGGTQ